VTEAENSHTRWLIAEFKRLQEVMDVELRSVRQSVKAEGREVMQAVEALAHALELQMNRVEEKLDAAAQYVARDERETREWRETIGQRLDAGLHRVHDLELWRTNAVEPDLNDHGDRIEVLEQTSSHWASKVSGVQWVGIAASSLLGLVLTLLGIWQILFR
jgi:hypothetical protein